MALPLSPEAGARLAGRHLIVGLSGGIACYKIADLVSTLVQGGADTGRALSIHDDVDGILFTGSYPVGRALEEAVLDQPGKLLALEMGGKNAVIVLDDADLDLAVAETALSICATTGQRCSCASRLFVHTDMMEAFAAKADKRDPEFQDLLPVQREL